MTGQRTAEAIVVGVLTRRGLRDVLLLDKGTAGGAASGRSGALVRALQQRPGGGPRARRAALVPQPERPDRRS